MGRQVVVFGASGAIGASVADRMEAAGDVVTRTARGAGADSDSGDVRDRRLVAVDPFGDAGMAALDELSGLAAVVWAQGANANDSVDGLDMARHLEVLQANTLFVTTTLAHLLERGALAEGARLCIISSIWQNLARQDKYSYTVSKAALQGVVHSAAVDLGRRGMLVNAVLPGVTDTAMTRAMLSPAQIAAFEATTTHGRLTSLDDISSLVEYLCSPANTGVTGQSIAVDLGYSVGRIV